MNNIINKNYYNVLGVDPTDISFGKVFPSYIDAEVQTLYKKIYFSFKTEEERNAYVTVVTEVINRVTCLNLIEDGCSDYELLSKRLNTVIYHVLLCINDMNVDDLEFVLECLKHGDFLAILGSVNKIRSIGILCLLLSTLGDSDNKDYEMFESDCRDKIDLNNLMHLVKTNLNRPNYEEVPKELIRRIPYNFNK